MDPNSGSLKDNDLFRRFFVCFNYENSDEDQLKKGLYIQYGIVQGHDSHRKVHLSYFDPKPIEPRYYMFGSYTEKVFVYDISIEDLTRDQEALFRCSTEQLYLTNRKRCDQFLCHKNCIGCSKANSKNHCSRCKYSEMSGDGDESQATCLDVCSPGFQKHGDQCVDVDECTRNETFLVYKAHTRSFVYEWKRCAKESTCYNVPGSFSCRCNAGFYGDGFVCVDIDECDFKHLKLSCPKNAQCINEPGSFRCVCSTGFRMSNQSRTCEDIDECESDDLNECQVNTQCKNTIGSYKCLCKKGYRAGTGVNCLGRKYF